MRIVSGKYKGRRIVAPKKLPTRPTTDQAKEALFNILKNYFHFPNISVLDLFSGIGSISLEFASRGTTDITAVDSFYGCVRFLKKTSDELEAGINCQKADVYDYLKYTGKNYDLIFADPPYDFTDTDFLKITEMVFENHLLSDVGMLVLEHSKHTDLSQHPFHQESRRYGSSVFSFFYEENNDEEL